MIIKVLLTISVSELKIELSKDPKLKSPDISFIWDMRLIFNNELSLFKMSSRFFSYEPYDWASSWTLPASILTIRLMMPIIKIDVIKLFNQAGNLFLIKGTLLSTPLISLTINHSKRANTKGIIMLWPTISINTNAMIVIR